MRFYKGLFYDQEVLLEESGQEHPLVGKMKGVKKECGDLYFYIFEFEDGCLRYIPRDCVIAVNLIEPIKKARVLNLVRQKE